MAIASSEAIEKIRDYAKKISIVFSPVFFGLAGAAFDIRAFFTTDWFFYAFFISLIIIAVISKIVGCGLPAAYFLKSGIKGKRVGYGMISRGEVGLIVAGVAISAGAITQSTYAAILGMIMVTTFVAPLLLRRSFENEPEELETNEETTAPDYIPSYPLSSSEEEKRPINDANMKVEHS
jgi:Kef-type K+ transport system membrane component KefB